MKKRYQVGFDEGVGNVLVFENPDKIAIVDTESPFGSGELIALCPCKKNADTIVHALNMVEVIKNFQLDSLMESV